MKLFQFDDVQEFWAIAQPYLLQHEAENNLPLSLINTLRHNPERYPDPPYLAIVSSGDNIDDEILALAMRTPPHKLVLSKAKDLRAIALIAQDIQNLPDAFPGISGPVAEVESCVQAWHALTGRPYHRSDELKIHQLTRVNPLEFAKGRLRLATESDRPLLLKWFTAFATELGGDIVIEAPEKSVDNSLKHRNTYLWQDQTPVSWANGRRSLPNLGRIGPVYTPPEHRRQGYATACVAALSQKLLDEGCKRCYLFTEVSNPTSNHIYREIGYRFICDWHQYTFRHD
ncbi:MAG: GNAT family N-acetyltransferase [Elainellaceae cyanobacterium]